MLFSIDNMQKEYKYFTNGNMRKKNHEELTMLLPESNSIAAFEKKNHIKNGKIDQFVYLHSLYYPMTL